MGAGGEEEAPKKSHHLNGMGVVDEVAPSPMVRVAVVGEVDQSFLVVSVTGCCCCCHVLTRGLELGACCGTWGRLQGEVARWKCATCISKVGRSQSG